MSGSSRKNWIYEESFQDGPGGWYGYINNAAGVKPLEWGVGGITSRSPWWVDYNHAPPGAGYIHMLACLSTAGPQSEMVKEAGGQNRFISGRFPLNFAGAVVRLRLRGELLARGAQVVLLLQGAESGVCSGWMLTGKPFLVGPSFIETSVELGSDPNDWTALGSRHDRNDMYGVRPLADVLSNVNVNIMILLFPLRIEPMGPLVGDVHLLRPEKDYPVWRSELPEGYVVLGSVSISFKDGFGR